MLYRKFHTKGAGASRLRRSLVLRGGLMPSSCRAINHTLTLAHSLLVAWLLPTCVAFAVSPATSVERAAISSRQPVVRACTVPVERLQPLNDYILVDLQSIPSQTATGVLLPTAFEDDNEDVAFNKPECRVGTVVAVGDGALTLDGARAPMPDISVGQKVLVSPAVGTRLQEEGKSMRDSTHFLFTAEEIWAAIEA